MPTLSEAFIREGSSQASFERGERYYRQGRVTGLERRGGVLSAQVEGGEDAPYRVRAALGEPQAASCTCPYEYGGFCKHIVAALLAYLSEPGLAEERPDLRALLAPLSAEQLRNALLHLLDEHPESLAALELHLSLETASSAGERPARLDPEPLRKQVRTLLRARDPDDAYGGSPDLAALFASVDERLARNDAENALLILEAVTDACVEAFEDIYGWQYEGEHPFDDLDLCWAEAVLSLDLSAGGRDGLLTDLLAWREQLEDFGVDAFYVAEAALAQGWDDPAVRALLRGEAADTGEAAFVSEDLTDLRLKVLERQGRQEDYLNLASARGRKAALLGMMLEQNRLGEVMAGYQTMLKTAGDALSLAQALDAKGEAGKALEVALFGLGLQTPPSPLAEISPFLADGLGVSRFELATWTAELAERLGEGGAALTARTDAFKERPSLGGYRRLEGLAGPDWGKLKGELLAALELRDYRFFTEARVDIFLHEGLVGRAMSAVEDADAHQGAIVERVMKAALENHADWVLEQAQRRAEPIMDEGKSQRYQDAARWLEHARAAYDRLDRFDDWELYLAKLEAKHKRRYKLLGHLRALRS